MSYGKIYDDFWDADDKIEGLSDDAALLAAFLFSGRHRNAIGCFRLGMGAITDIPRFGRWGIDRVSNAIQSLSDVGLILRDNATGWTLLVNALKRDPILGPKVAVHACKLADSVPVNSIVYPALKEKLEPQLLKEVEKLSKTNGWPMKSPIDTLSIGSRFPEPYPEPEPEPEPEPKQDVTAPAAPVQSELVIVSRETIPMVDTSKTDDDLVDSAPAGLVSSKRGTRLPADWVLTDEHRKFCNTERPDLDPERVGAEFRDYWISAPGQRGVKVDWLATWRNWVRNQRRGFFPVGGVSKTTQAFTDLERKLG